MQFPTLRLRIVATDIDPLAIRRAKRGCYRASSLKELPNKCLKDAFTTLADELCLKDAYRASVTFMVQDIRERSPKGPFHLILCRNLAFTYFDEALQTKTLQSLTDRLVPQGTLIIGKLESLPDGPKEIQPWSLRLGVYRKSPDTERD